MMVKITFSYDPNEPDNESSTGMSEREWCKLDDAVMVLGGYDMDAEVVE